MAVPSKAEMTAIRHKEEATAKYWLRVAESRDYQESPLGSGRVNHARELYEYHLTLAAMAGALCQLIYGGDDGTAGTL